MDNISKRVMMLAAYISDTGATVRSAAKVFGVSKSTVHKDMSERLADVSPALYEKVRKVLDLNKMERHIRGGNATKSKYEHLAQKRIDKILQNHT